MCDICIIFYTRSSRVSCPITDKKGRVIATLCGHPDNPNSRDSAHIEAANIMRRAQPCRIRHTNLKNLRRSKGSIILIHFLYIRSVGKRRRESASRCWISIWEYNFRFSSIIFEFWSILQLDNSEFGSHCTALHKVAWCCHVRVMSRACCTSCFVPISFYKLRLYYYSTSTAS